jgi:hypothetical protein
MAKKAKKAKKKARATAKEPKADKRTESKYKPQFAETLKMLVVECGMLNNRGEIAWSKIAKYLGVGRETLRNWRDPSKPRHFKAEFAAAVKEAIEAVNADQIKRSMIQRAQGYTQVKKITEVRENDDGDVTTVHRTEKTKMLGDVAAAKLVLPNIGPEDERWLDKKELTMAGGKLTDAECEDVRKMMEAQQK